MSYDELCKHFECHRPICLPVGKQHWFTAEFQSGNDSINDLLIRWLREWKIPYLRVNLGEQIWFLYPGCWSSCEQELHGNKVDFYLMEYVL